MNRRRNRSQNRKNRRKNRSQNRKKGICSKITVANVYFTICVCVFIYALASPILSVVLEHCGEQTEAIITSNTSSWVHRWTESCYMYEFSLNEKFYTGNSLIKEGESDKIGTKIKIYYFKNFPSFNRPLSYYDD